GRRERLRSTAQAEAAVTARLGPDLAEVGDQRVPLAAVVADQLDDLAQPRDLLGLARLEAAQQVGDQSGAVGDLALAAEAQARVRDAQLDQLLLGQVLERADRPRAV